MDPRATPPKRIRTSRRNKKNVIRWSRARKFDSNESCIVITIDIIYVLRAIQKKKKEKGKRQISAVAGSLLAMELHGDRQWSVMTASFCFLYF